MACDMLPVTVSSGDLAQEPGKVLNRLNVRQSGIFTEFPLKDSFKLRDGI